MKGGVNYMKILISEENLLAFQLILEEEGYIYIPSCLHYDEKDRMIGEIVSLEDTSHACPVCGQATEWEYCSFHCSKIDRENN